MKRRQTKQDDCNPETIQALADLFKHLGDHNRLRLLLLLAKGEVPVGLLAARLEMTASAVSHQLKSLRLARLVARRREGQSIFYRLNDDHVHQLVAIGRAHVMEP